MSAEAPPPPPTFRSRVRGCLLGTAAGDALGAAVEFVSWTEIRRRFGAAGVTAIQPAFGAPAAITDDTQLTLFTTEALLVAARGRGGLDAAALRGPLWRAYHRWLRTQGESPTVARGMVLDAEDGGAWLLDEPWLQARRAPGTTCLASLKSGRVGSVARPINDRKGCGGVMRVAPLGLPPQLTLGDAFRLGTEAAAITHGHPTGYLAAGVYSALVNRLVAGCSLSAALSAARGELARWPGHEETTAALAAAAAAGSDRPTPERVERLGAGWIAEEALAIAVFCVLAAPSPRAALLAAVNHSGDSDSTGAIAGGLLGSAYGEAALPGDFLAPLEGRLAIERLADELAVAFAPACES